MEGSGNEFNVLLTQVIYGHRIFQVHLHLCKMALSPICVQLDSETEDDVKYTAYKWNKRALHQRVTDLIDRGAQGT